jgi:coenzyme F420 hydrogenase subunit beta
MNHILKKIFIMNQSLPILSDVIQYNMCMSCGACQSFSGQKHIEMRFNDKKGYFLPEIKNSSYNTNELWEICPGKGYPIYSMSTKLFGNDSNEYCYELGYTNLRLAATSLNNEIIKGATSGGIISTISYYLLSTRQVDGVTATRFVYTENGPKVEDFIARTKHDVLESQGSKYVPSMTNLLIELCEKEGGKYLFIGTPCQIAALRLMSEKNKTLRKIFPYTLANFCGGYRDYRHLKFLFYKYNIEPGKVVNFRFRGGGQPGTMLIETSDRNIVLAKYPEYNNFTPIPKLFRCTFCEDATGELADFSCGDAWIERFLSDRRNWSIVFCRSSKATLLMNELIDKNLIEVQEITKNEIIESQLENLQSKKYRQYKRRKIYSILGKKLPSFDLILPKTFGSYQNEIRIILGKSILGTLYRTIKLKLSFWIPHIQ